MCNIKIPILTLLFFVLITSCSVSQEKTRAKIEGHSFEVSKTDAEWKAILTEEEYYVLRKKGTEIAFTGDLWDNHEKGLFVCAACNQKLFASLTKFESGSGWPSFFEPIDDENVKIVRDVSFGMVREEVVCGNCGGHLGHVFSDGPEPTGLRYCINSVAMNFIKDKD